MHTCCIDICYQKDTSCIWFCTFIFLFKSQVVRVNLRINGSKVRNSGGNPLQHILGSCLDAIRSGKAPHGGLKVIVYVWSLYGSRQVFFLSFLTQLLSVDLQLFRFVLREKVLWIIHFNGNFYNNGQVTVLYRCRNIWGGRESSFFTAFSVKKSFLVYIKPTVKFC